MNLFPQLRKTSPKKQKTPKPKKNSYLEKTKVNGEENIKEGFFPYSESLVSSIQAPFLIVFVHN